MTLNCLITGVGGQGTVLMARLIGNAAILRGLDVLGAETIGMAQRGGSVVSHIRIGAGPRSPLIPPGRADLVIAFEPAEAVRVLPCLAPAGRLLALDRGVAPVSSSLAPGNSAGYDPSAMAAWLRQTLGGRASILDGEGLIRRCGNARALNAALLGAALKLGLLPFAAGEIEEVIKTMLPAKFVDMNLAALKTGQEL
ncbi:MAG: 2-oxoacid:acceptor oxidoreductase family protein [Treponema sp.]|jgi:indolepyruvate ferredoxin oxidoreductase beta subunit|nr:2-oxoacid:acceptor oxidoreductase family protein [Treponema sp.]